MSPRISVVTLVWNNWTKSKRGLESIAKHLEPRPDVHEVLVLDNGSDESVANELALFVNDHPKFRLIRSDHNLGCGGGRAMVFPMATGDRILSIDSDATVMSPSLIDDAERAMSIGHTGIVGCFGGNLNHEKTPGFDMAQPNFEGPVDCVSGYCQYIRREVFSKTQFDPRFYAGGAEDLDFCLSAKDATGWDCYQIPLPVWHASSHTATYDLPRLWGIFVRKWRMKFPRKPQRWHTVHRGRSPLADLRSCSPACTPERIRNCEVPATERHVPAVIRALSDYERLILEAWYRDTQAISRISEMGISMISVLAALIEGSRICRVVQCGHFFGYSAMLMGFSLRAMGIKRGLWTVDIDVPASVYTAQWVQYSGLQDHVHIHTDCSANPANPELAIEYLGGRPTLIVIDSSHQYAHTLRELDLWYDALEPGGLIAMHDTSRTAQRWDDTEQGGVKRAVEEWLYNKDLETRCLLLNQDAKTSAYGDTNGLGLIQKPEQVSDQ